MSRRGLYAALMIVALICSVTVTTRASVLSAGGPDVVIDGVNLSQVSFPVAYARLNQKAQEFTRNFEIKVIINSKEYYIHSNDINISTAGAKQLRDIWYGVNALPPGAVVPLDYAYDEDALNTRADEIIAELYKDVTPESEMAKVFNSETKKLQVDGSKNYIIGYDLKPDEFKLQLEGKVESATRDSAGYKSALNIKTNPVRTAGNNAPTYDLLGTYTTYTTNVANRNENIRLASEIISGKMLQPGEVFSYYGVLGRVSAARGFKEAGILVNGQPDTGIGGGICQVSSTLYNACLEAGMQIVERHAHSRDVGYVPHGKDATVAWPSLDYKFRNNTANSLYVILNYNNRTLTASLYGKR
ncbi:MAG: VanW family protein [Clostridiales bacterium]|nr:VanW family protein [Clostridiales bacterium]